MPNTRVLGTGRFLPARVVTNEEMSQLVTTSDEWIRQRSGVVTRHYAGPEDTPATMGTAAARAALEMAGLEPGDLDFIICATQTPEYLFPGTGCVIQAQLGVTGIGALDVRNQCTGFLYGLSVADAFIRLGTYKRILLVCTELHSRGLEFSDEGRHVTVLFGDGAGAVVLGPEEREGYGVLSVHLHADGRHARELMIEGPGFAFDPWCNPEIFAQGRHFPKMNGKLVFKEAVSCMREVVGQTLQVNALQTDQVDHFIPHQANKRINEAVAGHFGIPLERVDCSIERYGNCAAASVPIALDERVRGGLVKPDQRILFATFAAGFTWGGAALRW